MKTATDFLEDANIDYKFEICRYIANGNHAPLGNDSAGLLRKARGVGAVANLVNDLREDR
jgi:hypothetical protein